MTDEPNTAACGAHGRFTASVLGTGSGTAADPDVDDGTPMDAIEGRIAALLLLLVLLVLIPTLGRRAARAASVAAARVCRADSVLTRAADAAALEAAH